jgi:hypothetical protein
MSNRAACLAIAALFLSSCGDEGDPARIAEPAPFTPGTTPTTFNLRAWLSRDRSRPDSAHRWQLTASLYVGYLDGEPRSASDTLWIDGEPLLPASANAMYRNYRFDQPIDPSLAHERVIRVQPPTVNGESPAEISFAFVGRSGGDTILRALGGDVIIPILTPLAPPDPSPSETSWEVTISSVDATWVQLASPGMPSDPLRIPPLYLPSEESDATISFWIGFDRRPASQPAEDEYVSIYRVSSRFEWSIVSGRTVSTEHSTEP